MSFAKANQFNWKSSIKTNIFLLRIIGLWPKGDETYKLDIYTVYATASVTLFCLCHCILQIVTLFHIYNDLEAFTALIFICLSELNSIPKSYFVVKNMERLKQLMITLESDMFQPKSAKQVRLVEPNLKNWRLAFKIYWSNTICALILMTVFPIIDQSIEEHRLPLSMWYPFNTKMSPIYEITYIYQLLCIYYICNIDVSVDTLIAALNTYISSQCDILCDDLKSIEGDNNVIESKLQKCIFHHKKILKFAEESQNFFNWIVLTQFFTSTVTIGITMFQLTVVSSLSSEFHSLIFYLTAVVVEIFIYCWFGNEVQVKSSNIAYAAFQSHWVGSTKKIQKKVNYLILKCQTPIKMSALNIFYLSLDTFIKILRTAWSYFAVLQQVNSPK